MKRTFIIGGLLAVILVMMGMAIGWWFGGNANLRVGYVSTTQLYDRFDYKLEMEKELGGVERRRKQVLDSLALDVQKLSTEADRSAEQRKQFEQTRRQYGMLQEQFSDEHETMVRSYQEKILKQMNQYVKEYGDAHHYDYIMGADGSGALMYANNAHDLTEPVSKYINERYKGHY